jgi:hypothetical protein
MGTAKQYVCMFFDENNIYAYFHSEVSVHLIISTRINTYAKVNKCAIWSKQTSTCNVTKYG